MSLKSEEPPALFLVGTAGSGKTTLAFSLAEWLGRKGIEAEVLNLDPGVEYLPYDPIVDVREYVDVRELMRTKGLGPNSSLVLATDMLA
ncbi:MAG TPA: ATP/GTP-binding protein, partial [Thermoproteota archaeon]|nr:ATP/GTP-binding protein [Thermoproteota archaeon]